MFMGKNGGFVENILYIRSKCLLLRRNCYEYMRMKRIFTILLSALFAASCSTDTFVPTNNGDGKIEVSIGQSATIKTRTLIAEDGYSARWSGGDKIAIWAANELGEYELAAEPFTMYHISEVWETAIFTATINPLTSDSYTYYATYPTPTSVSGTTATFTLPATQNGSNAMGVRDIMVATPSVGNALNAEKVTKLDMLFTHKMHAIRIILPQNTMNDMKATRVEMVFPTAVVGDVAVDFTDPTAPTTLSNGSNILNIEIPDNYQAGDYLWAMIYPTELTGEVSYRVWAGEYSSKEKVISLNKTAQPSHISPMSIPVPDPEPATTFIIEVPENNLGEEFNTLTILDSNGNTIKSFTPRANNIYSWVINGEIDAAVYADKTFTFRYDSDHAIVEDKVVFNNFVAYDYNNYTSKVPYLLFEDFSCITTESESYGNNSYAASDRDQPGNSLDGIMCTAGWNAARYWTTGSCIRINARSQATKILMLFASQHYGRLDTPQLKNLKSGADVKIKVTFDAGGYIHKSSSFSTSGVHVALATHTNAANPIDGIPVGTSGLGQNYSTTLNDFGTTHYTFQNLTDVGENAFGSSFPTFSTNIASATAATRLCFYPIIECDNDGTGNAEGNVYIDNIRVSIVK